jgi:hypothetical protein
LANQPPFSSVLFFQDRKRSRRTRKRLEFGFVLTFLIAFFANNAAGSLVPLGEITVVGTVCTTCGPVVLYPPENTIDGDYSTFWHGTNNLQIGDFDLLAYNFARPVQLTAVNLFMGADDDVYTLGELEIQTSTDTTDGFDGTWTTLASLPGTTPEFEVTVSLSVMTEWLRLRPEYQGDGGSGTSPAFYLRETTFEEVRVAPEPGITALLLLSALGLTAFLPRQSPYVK